MTVRPAPARLAAIVALALAAALVGPAASASSSSSDERRGYIVVFEQRVANPARVARTQTENRDANLKYVYRHALKGYAASMTAEQAAKLEASRRVAYVERDRVVSISTTQTGATWGLDRIDQRALPLSGTYTYTNTGSGVKAYIIDTGIRYSHSQFGGRAIFGTDKVLGGLLGGGGATGGSDCNGHGTHVAGTVGGSTYGVAKQVTLVAVRVLGCDGSGQTSWVIAGIDWVTANHQAGQPAVANMSLGGGASSSLDTAVRNSIADGVSYAIAAGNGNILGQAQNACNYSPARVAEAMTIGATDSSDRKASWSNYGTCVDWFAPGVSITSAWYTSDTATNTISGTSMATPHVAGVAAQYLQSSPGASPATVRNALYDLTTKAIVTSSNTANNHLLFTNL
jgi:subtilisin family serine protease